MNRRSLLFALAAGAFTRPASAAALVRHETPRMVADIAIQSRDGQTLKLQQLLGQPIVLHIWATWCGSCRTEFPSLLRFQQTFAGRVKLLAVSIDRLGWPIIDRTLDELSATALSVYHDPSRDSVPLLGVFGLPTTLILDRQGREVARAPGALDWDDPQVAALLEDVLAT